MCVTCGCSDGAQTTLTKPQTGETTKHDSSSDRHHSHTHTLAESSVIAGFYTKSNKVSKTKESLAGEKDRHHSHTLEDARVIK